MVVLNSVLGSYILHKMWWLDNAMSSPKLFYYPLRHREKLHSLDLLTSRWDCETEFWLMVLGKNKVHHFQDCPLNIPHNLPPPFSPAPVVKKVTDLYNVRSLDKCAPCLEENHSETPPDQKYMH